MLVHVVKLDLVVPWLLIRKGVHCLLLENARRAFFALLTSWSSSNVSNDFGVVGLLTFFVLNINVQ